MDFSSIDTLLFFFVNRDLQNTLFDVAMPVVTKNAELLFLPLFLWFLFKDRKKALIVLILGVSSLLLTDWSSNVLKHFVERPRPCNELEGVRTLIGCGRAFSMPSAHASNAFAFAVPFFILFGNRASYLMLALAAVISFSRIYVGVHYPSDVIVGALLGMSMSAAVYGVYHWGAARYREKPHSTVLIFSLIAISIFRIYYILNGPLDLSPDEAHYWEWSRRPDLSYYSKGPMIAYLIYLGTHIFGDNAFGIRIMAVIMSAAGSIALFAFIRKMYGDKVAAFSALLLQVVPLFSTYGVIFTIDSPFIFFWVLSLYFFHEAVRNEGDKFHLKAIAYWKLLGVSIGFGLLTKYTMAFFYLCGLFFLVSSKEQRKLLFSGGPYFSIVISLLIFSPVIFWNAEHNWVTLRHTSGQAHIADGFRLSPQYLIDFLGSQLGVVTPLLFILSAIALLEMRKDRHGPFLLAFSVPIFLFFLVKSLQGKVQANWALPAYITAIAAFSAFFVGGFAAATRGKKIIISAAVVLPILVTAVAHYPSAFRLPPDLDPTVRLLGWRDLGAGVSRLHEEMSPKGPTFVFSDKYQISSELAFYMKGHPVTYCVNFGRRMNQYDIWPSFDNLLHRNAIFVRTGNAGVLPEIETAFRKVEKKTVTTYTKRRVKIKDYSVFLCYDFQGLKMKKPEAY